LGDEERREAALPQERELAGIGHLSGLPMRISLSL
jgi:hypothetical protein